MSNSKMWTYPELKFITIHKYKMNPEELACEVNKKFHGSMQVRDCIDVKRIHKSRNIFNKDKDPRLVF